MYLYSTDYWTPSEQWLNFPGLQYTTFQAPQRSNHSSQPQWWLQDYCSQWTQPEYQNRNLHPWAHLLDLSSDPGNVHNNLAPSHTKSLRWGVDSSIEFIKNSLPSPCEHWEPIFKGRIRGLFVMLMLKSLPCGMELPGWGLVKMDWELEGKTVSWFKGGEKVRKLAQTRANYVLWYQYLQEREVEINHRVLQVSR